MVLTHLEAIAVTISDPNKLTICNIYLPRSHNFNLADLQQLTDQLPKPYIIVGDFNSHNTLWSSPNIDNRGKIVENWIENDNIILLNTGDPTHFNCSSGSFSTIDLSLCSAYIADRVVCSVDSDLFDSDHYPIHIKMNRGENPCTSSSKPLWKFKEAKWDRYAERLELLLSTIDIPTTTNSQGYSDLIYTLNSAIYQAADENIPKSTGKYRNKEVRWWNDKCEQASKAAKHAFNAFKKASLSSTQSHQIVNLKIEFKKLRAKARLTFKTSKSEAWKKFVTSLNRNAPNQKIWNSIKARLITDGVPPGESQVRER